MTNRSPFRYFKTSPEIIRLVVMYYVGFMLSLRKVEDLLDERGMDINHETARFWQNGFGPMFASEIRKRRIEGLKSSYWRWQLDEVFVGINSRQYYLWRAVDHEGEVLEIYVTNKRDEEAMLKFLWKAMRKHGNTQVIVTNNRWRMHYPILRRHHCAPRRLGLMQFYRSMDTAPVTRTGCAKIKSLPITTPHWLMLERNKMRLFFAPFRTCDLKMLCEIDVDDI